MVEWPRGIILHISVRLGHRHNASVAAETCATGKSSAISVLYDAMLTLASIGCCNCKTRASHGSCSSSTWATEQVAQDPISAALAFLTKVAADTKLTAGLTDPVKGANPYNNRRFEGFGSTRPSSTPRKNASRIVFCCFRLRGGSSPPTCAGWERG
jgi:hypothetical protein